MYRFLFTPRWLGFHLLVIVGIVTMVNLGFWQLRRLDERTAFNAQVSERIEDPPAPLDDVLRADTDPDGVEWRSVTARGTYLRDEQFLVVNRSQGGIGGTMVVTPLQLADGRLLLVERGFQPGTTAAAAAPSGTVDVVGRLRPSEQRRTGQLSDPAEGELQEAQRLDIARLAPQLPGPPVPMFIELTASQPAEPKPYPAPVTLPELTSGPHLSYAVQWFTFSAAVMVGWVLAVRKSLRTRRRAGPPAAAAATPEAVGAAPPSSSG
jgi:cytochrome oxidase assembly protein ShyY1